MYRPNCRALTLTVVVCAFAPLALAWNGYGHQLSAYVAYQNLKPETKKRVNELLRKHPDYDRLLSKDCPSGFDKDLYVFMKAATWPDLMRDKALDPDLKEHHGPWHYINVPIGSASHTPAPERTWKAGTDPENVLQAIVKCESDCRDAATADAERAKRLCWIEHLVGDLHQPLHTVSAFFEGFESGDQGGNLFLVSENGKVWKLHAYWDDLVGFGDDVRKIAKHGDGIGRSKSLSREALAAELGKGTISDWTDAGVDLAQDVAYAAGALHGQKSLDKDHLPATAPALPSDYRKKAAAVAEKQLALAGYRLADRLNAVLSPPRQ